MEDIVGIVNGADYSVAVHMELLAKGRNKLRERFLVAGPGSLEVL
ncbi:hypothetical protein ARTHRO9V_240173 [Arthrobacter sp. 9V]|nr:hypothetical protein ARTHRO9V_240173 [Arthrobacter sp. 9V]